jgi:plastocyanin
MNMWNMKCLAGTAYAASTLALALTLALTLALSGQAMASSITVTVQDKSGAPVADAVAFAVPVGAKFSPKATPGKIDQVNKEFDPLVSVIPVGTPVSFPNRDDIRHHVYSFSPAKPFELKLYTGKPAAPVVFDKPGVVVLGCNIHDWMVAYVVVVDTNYFGKTDATGRVKLDGLPPGEYDLKLWHYRVTSFNEMSAERRVLVGAAPTTSVFSVELKPQKSPATAPK